MRLAIRRRWWPWARRGLVAIVVVALGLALSAWFLLGTARGGELLLAVVAGRAPFAVRVDEFSGRLFDRFRLAGVRIETEAAEVTIRAVSVDWRVTALTRRTVDVRSVDLEGVEVRLLERAKPEVPRETVADSARTPPVPELPVRIRLASGTARGITVTRGDVTWLSDGEVRIAGEMSDYRLDLSGEVTPPGVTPAVLSLTGSGTSETLRLDRITASLLGGRVEGSGRLRWWPDVSWSLTLAGDSIHPGLLADEPDVWPGALHASIATHGEVGADGLPRMVAAADTVFGSLSGEQVAGRMEVELHGRDIEVRSSRLMWGPASLEAAGRVSGDVDLSFEARVPDLGLLTPGGAGELHATGRAIGPRSAPRITARVAASGVRTAQAEAERVAGDVDLDFGGRLAAEVRAVGITAGGRAIDSAAARLTGTRGSHALAAYAHGAGLELEVEARGGLAVAPEWSGSLHLLRLEGPGLGTWSLEEPAAVRVSSREQAVEGACLSSPPARVCVSGMRAGDVWSVEGRVDSLAAERFSSLLPHGLTIETTANASGAVRRTADGRILGHVEAVTGPGEASLPLRGDSRRVRFSPVSLAAHSDSTGVAGDLEVAVDDLEGRRLLTLSGSANLSAGVSRLADFRALGRGPGEGRVELHIADLTLLAGRLPPDAQLSGSLGVEAELRAGEGGEVSGRVRVEGDSLELRRRVRGEQRALRAEPARLDAAIGPDGLTAGLAVQVSTPRLGPIFTVDGSLSIPGLSRLDADLKSLPVEGTVDASVADLAIVEAILVDVSDAAGRFDLHSEVTGTAGDLAVTGEARLTDGSALVPNLGIRLTDMQFTATGTRDGAVEIAGQMRSGTGRVTLHGRSPAIPTAADPTRIDVRGERFMVVDIPQARIEAAPSLDFTFDGTTAWIRGDVSLPSGRLGIPDIPEEAVAPSQDVVIVGDSVAPREPPVPLGIEVRVAIGPDVFFNGLGFAANLEGEIDVRQEPGGEPRGRGEVRIVRGTYRNLGQELRIDPGRLVFAGPLDDPAVDARAYVRATDGTEAGFRIGGTAQNLAVTTYSQPPKSESDIISYILFGRPMSQTSSAEGSQASNTAALLGANVLAMSLAPSVGLDEARIESGARQNEAQFVVGKYLSPKLYLGYGVGIYEPISTLRIRYLLTSKWTVEAITGDQQSTDLLYRIERGGVGTAGEPETSASETPTVPPDVDEHSRPERPGSGPGVSATENAGLRPDTVRSGSALMRRASRCPASSSGNGACSR